MNAAIGRSPSKLILSGEHAVLYGAPAIGLTLQPTCTCTLEVLPDPAGSIAIIIPKLAMHASMTRLRLRSTERKKQSPPNDTVTDFLIHAIQLYDAQYPLDDNLAYTFHFDSDIPMGAGMGSSAATVISLYRALNAHHQITMDHSALHQLATAAENFQHGLSSGLDIALCLGSGCQYYDQNTYHNLPSWPSPDIQIIFTGQPSSNTQACIAHCQPLLHHNAERLSAFSDITHAMHRQLTHPTTTQDWAPLIKKNHALLVSLGVVPDRIQAMVAVLEQGGCAAKIAGAGSISGEQAGTLWAVGDPQIIQGIAEDHGFQYARIPLHHEH